MIEPGLNHVRSTIELLGCHFECPVLVHNATNLRRHNSTLVDRVKIALSRRARHLARREANCLLDQCIRSMSSLSLVSILDEYDLLNRHSEWELGRRFLDAEVQHPAELARRLAMIYFDYLIVRTNLLSKKILVCDLDNTLWEGEIGEGVIKHYHQRQATLKRLRNKGILLAINSKNDVSNVKWMGSQLDERDFVASCINWNPKTVNMNEIRESLNLKTKDFVFIDDRPDQLEMISVSFPEILCFEATSERVWRQLDLWACLLPDQDELDRTQLYHEREQRQSFVTHEAESADLAELTKRLGLSATIRLASPSDLKRAADLINRTNQYNLTGSRVTLSDLRKWAASPGKAILLVDGADKFGRMGTVCLALIDQRQAEVSVPVFVLSCRVFGYGFETAMLNTLAQFAAKSGSSRVAGYYTKTPLNEPCKNMYPDHGFVWSGERWLLQIPAPITIPEWLYVTDKTG